MSTREEIINAYRRLGNIAAVCMETGCQPYIAYKILKISKVLKAKEGTVYGTHSQKQGARAELEFKRLVPFAMPANETMQNNCPVYDFDINGTTVDVKFCSFCSGAGRYSFRTAQSKHFRPDWYCAFMADTDVKELITGQYRVVLIPDDAVQQVKSVSFTERGSRYWDFEIPPQELAAFFREYLPLNQHREEVVTQLNARRVAL